MTLLVIRPAPYPDESLTSYVERLAQANHYDPPQLLSSWLRASNSTKLLEPNQPAQRLLFYEQLMRLTGRPVSQLLALTPHRFVPVLLPPDVSPDECNIDGQRFRLLPRGHFKLLRPDTSAGFCPACLREGSYHRLPWQFIPIATCLIHQCALVDRCSQCDNPLPVRAVSVSCCSVCHCDLRDCDSLPLASDDLLLQTQRCLYAWLEGGEAPASLNLPPVSGQVLFRVLDGLRRAVQVARADEWTFAPDSAVMQSIPGNNTHYRLSPSQSGSLYAAALHGLKDWPEGFFAFLDAYRQRGQGSSLKSLGTLYSLWLQNYWQHPAFEFVQEAFDQYLISHFPPTRSLLSSARSQQRPGLIEQLPYVDVRGAARMMGTSPPKIHRLIRDGLLDVYPESDPVQPSVLLYRSQVEAFQEPQATALPLCDAAAYLGLRTALLNDMLKRGMLLPTGRQYQQGEWVPGLTYQDIDDWYACLKAHVTVQPLSTESGVRLNRAAILNGKVGLKLVDLLERVLAGELAAYHPSADLRPLKDLWFDEAAILSLTQQVKDENGWVSFLETAAWLNVGRCVLHHWIDSGLLVPVASFARAQYFLRADVLDFQERCVFGPEAMAILNIPRTALSQWARRGYLDPLSGPGINNHGRYVFDRFMLEAWHHAYVSTPETKQLLQATDVMLRRWREAGKLTRLVSEPRIAGFYRRDEVLNLQQTLSLAQKL